VGSREQRRREGGGGKEGTEIEKGVDRRRGKKEEVELVERGLGRVLVGGGRGDAKGLDLQYIPWRFLSLLSA
jgi:hypothetical protein